MSTNAHFQKFSSQKRSIYVRYKIIITACYSPIFFFIKYHLEVSKQVFNTSAYFFSINLQYVIVKQGIERVETQYLCSIDIIKKKLMIFICL